MMKGESMYRDGKPQKGDVVKIIAYKHDVGKTHPLKEGQTILFDKPNLLDKVLANAWHSVVQILF